jgi:hypothetical protein
MKLPVSNATNPESETTRRTLIDIKDLDAVIEQSKEMRR